MRRNHYEAAFEAFLRSSKIPYISNRQDDRCPCDDGRSIKNFDVVLSLPTRGNWIVDIKGRKFPGGGRRYWKNWTTRDDWVGLLHWEKILGDQFRGIFVFAYLIEGDFAPIPFERLFSWRKRLYAFLGVELRQYLGEARLISPRWRTYEIPIPRFRKIARPLNDFLAAEQTIF